MLREIPDCELGDNRDYARWGFEVMRAEWGAEEQQGKSKPTSILSDVLAKAEEKRFTKAVEGVRKGEYAVQITHLSEILVAAYVTNGDGKQRGVSIS